MCVCIYIYIDICIVVNIVFIERQERVPVSSDCIFLGLLRSHYFAGGGEAAAIRIVLHVPKDLQIPTPYLTTRFYVEPCQTCITGYILALIIE